MPIVRRVLPNEYHKYRTHLKALDAESKYLRFGYPVSDCLIDKLCDTIEADIDHHVLFCVETDQLEFAAIGHIATSQGMELAFSVLKQYQGCGMGNALMRRSIQWCRTHNLLTGHMVCLSSNATIRHLCTKYGIKMKSEFGETSAEINLDAADVGTYIEQLVDQQAAIVDFMSKRIAASLSI